MLTIFAMLAAQAATPAGPPPERSFFTASGRGLWVYHMQQVNCAELRYHIGRNGVNGIWTMPFAQARWSVAPQTGNGQGSVALSCADGSACITYRRGPGANAPTSQGTSRVVPFENEAGAQAFVERLGRLRQTCAAGSSGG